MVCNASLDAHRRNLLSFRKYLLVFFRGASWDECCWKSSNIGDILKKYSIKNSNELKTQEIIISRRLLKHLAEIGVSHKKKYDGTPPMYHGTLPMYHGTLSMYHVAFSYGLVWDIASLSTICTSKSFFLLLGPQFIVLVHTLIHGLTTCSDPVGALWTGKLSYSWVSEFAIYWISGPSAIPRMILVFYDK